MLSMPSFINMWFGGYRLLWFSVHKYYMIAPNNQNLFYDFVGLDQSPNVVWYAPSLTTV